MRRASVVIGANFGDEGKGLMTDWLAGSADGNAIVVRFNGGAQAGHTVVTPDGRRHVFGHFGSGSFAGAATFLSRFFVHNPLTAESEYARLTSLAGRPQVYADPQGLVTTPYDMLINQTVERARGAGRHGSCGLGFGETIERNLTPRYALTIADLADPTRVVRRLLDIRDGYVPQRLRQLGVMDWPEDLAALLAGDDLVARFADTLDVFRDMIQVADITILERFRHIIFEGAQGLLLDQDHGWFPYVSRSHTGLKNVVALARQAGLEALDVTYMTRSYLTRHGAGPLPGELPARPYAGIVDATNIANPWQGWLRFAWLDADLLARTIRHDMAMAEVPPCLRMSFGLGVTCLDQVGDSPGFLVNGTFTSGPPDSLAAALSRRTGLPLAMTGWGPSRSTVVSGDPQAWAA